MELSKDAEASLHHHTAGIPDQRASALFLHHIEADQLLLQLEEVLCPRVIQYFTRLLKTFCDNTDRAVTEGECAAAVAKVLKFAHEFTSGHSFPCLKMVEFFVTETPEQCLVNDVCMALQRFIASPHFTPVCDEIYNRCYAGIEGETLSSLTGAWWVPGLAATGGAWMDLIRLGLWLPAENRFVSLQLQHWCTGWAYMGVLR